MTIQPQTFLVVRCLFCINWTSLDSRPLDFYKTYAHLHRSPTTSIRQLLKGSGRPYRAVGHIGEFLVLPHRTNLSTPVHPCFWQNRDDRAQLQLCEAYFTLEGLRGPRVKDTVEMQPHWLKEKLGRASEPSPKGEHSVLRLSFTRRGDTLACPFCSTRAIWKTLKTG